VCLPEVRHWNIHWSEHTNSCWYN